MLDIPLFLKINQPKQIVSWITILIISTIAFLTVGLYYEYPKYLKLRGEVVEDQNEFLVKTVVMETDLLKLKKSKLIIENKYIRHQINYIKTTYYLDNEAQKYYEVLLNVNLDNNLKKNQLPILMKFELPKTTLIKEFINSIKKGMI
ncbi:MAG: hypothetical protein PHI05_04070 [Bacilli bacterium]|nr:hypothetical protein [Bacilli bacterium]